MDEDSVLFLKSSKKNGGSGDDDDDSGAPDEVWDDTKLINAYDKAMEKAESDLKTLFQKSGGRSQTSTTGVKWCKGDKCKCKYSVDGVYYEADVIDVLPNGKNVIVKYIGYENKEKVPMKKLLPSDGEPARTLQLAMASSSAAASADTESEPTEAASGERSRVEGREGRKQGKKGERGRCRASTPHSLDPQLFIPPPPPPLALPSPPAQTEGDAMTAMLMSWYMNGYHTGYYQGLKNAQK